MRVLMGLYGLRELGHNQVKGPLVVEPMRQEMHAHKRQTGPDADDRCARDSRARGWRVTRTSLATIEGYPPKPGHFVSSITYRQGLMALPGQGQCIDLR